jgi:hypothetical protein
MWWLPPLPWIAYAGVLSAAGVARWDHLVVALVVAAAAYTSAGTRRFFLSALPLLLMFLLYDSLRYWCTIGLDPGAVLSCGVRRAEQLLFGVRLDGAGLLTPNELLGRLRRPALDLLCAIPYGAYLFVLVAHFIYLFFTDLQTARRFAWIALGTHLLGFATYRLLPAAPPWYVDLHGCAVDLATRSNPAGLLRVDAMLGTTYFRDLYTRGATVFGALPSLHAAYPFFGLLATFRRAGPASRAIQIAYAFWMAFAAVYLNHHWLIDVLLGIVYAGIAAFVVGRLLPEASERARK